MSNPLSRPTRDEGEEDLLRLQQQFLKQKQAGTKKDVVDLHTDTDKDHNIMTSRKRKINKEPACADKDVYKTMDAQDSDLVSILTDICEMNVGDRSITTPTPTARGFPCVKDYKIGKNTPVAGTGRKKSLFARQFDKTHSFVPRERESAGKSHKIGMGTSSFLENVLPAERLAIEEQTNRIFNKMSEEEKKQEAERIFKNMDPKLVEFLKKRKKEAEAKAAAEKAAERTQANIIPVEMMDVAETIGGDACCNDHDFLHPDKRKVMIEGSEVEIPIYLKPGHHPNMGVLEAGKLEWMSDIPQTKPVVAAAKEGNNEDEPERQVRFDFDGKIVPAGTEVHHDMGLHHHGEEPSAAGYTLDELFILSRSAVPRQRQIALETVVHITQRARHALYSKYVKQPMLKLMLDSGVVQLYRHALDTPDYELALQGLAALLVAPTEILIQDEVYPDMSLYTLQPDTGITKDMDHDTVLETDVVRLLVDSQLPQRFWYLLTKHEVTVTMVDNVLNIVQHLVQHSLHVAMVLVKHELLLDRLIEIFLPSDLNHALCCEEMECFSGHPNHIVIKILRTLCCYSKNIAAKLSKRYSLDQTVKLYISLNHKDFKGREMLACQIEVCRLWEVLLKWGLSVSVYSAVYPLLVRELSVGGQRSVKLTSSLIHALTTGIHVFQWSDVGCLYHPILTTLMSWATRPPSGKELPPNDDIMLISAVLKFLSSYTKLHHSKHYNVNLVEQVSDLVDRVLRPLVTGTLFDNVLNNMIYCKAFLSKQLLQISSLPTLELHQYHQPSSSASSTLDLTRLSPTGEELVLFYSCSCLIRQTVRFLTTCWDVNKDLGEIVVGFLEKSSKPVLSGLDRHRSYRHGKLDSKVPGLVFHNITQLQLDYILLAQKVRRRNKGMFAEELLLKTGIKIISELRAGFEFQQFQLISGYLFDPVINKASFGCGHLFLKSFEAAVSRNKIMKSQKYWSEKVDPEQALFIGKIVAQTGINNSWVFLSPEVLSPLTENAIVEYLEFLEYLLTKDGMLSSVPDCVQLIRIMDIFMLPSQHFLSPKISSYLKKFLDYFSNLEYIDFKDTKISGHPSFYDFYNMFCETYEAEGFCDPVFAGFILLPTRCDYALTYRRLIWVERVETLRVLRTSAIQLPKTLAKIETDADMMTIYVTALKNGISGLPKQIALHHLSRFLVDDRVRKSEELLRLVVRYLRLCPEEVKEEVVRFERVNEFNEVVFLEKVPAGRREKMGLMEIL